ncbi:phosphopantetheine-binding protein [Streptomyces sp. NBC_00144]|uniref:phosphopantetheine-binding protein n=1 Tax=Streptomyces sp. NBC_00144 TaxID=2975665 RepID=UPI003245D499
MLNTIEGSTNATLEQLRAGLAYTGTAQFGSCIQQATCNVLTAQGLEQAPDRIGVSWGFNYGPGADRLRSGERWLAGIARLSALHIQRQRFDSATAAFAAEQSALDGGSPVVVAVDSFDITSPHLGRTHLMHALILVEWGPESVTVLDPMNEPRPSLLSLDTYRRTRASAVARNFELIAFEGTLADGYSAIEALAALNTDALTHRETGLADLEVFIRAVESGQAVPDVADVAAERTYAQKVIAAAARELPGLESLAAKTDALARRWYFAHTMGMEAGGQPTQRMAKVLRDLRERETRLLDELASTVDAAGLAPADTPATPGSAQLISLISSVLARQTRVATERLKPSDDLWAAGLTSLESVRVMIGLEDELGIEFPTSLLARNTFGSIAAIAEALAGLLAGTSDTTEGQVGR